MENHGRMSVRHPHWGIVSAPALAVVLWFGAMPGTAPEATLAQEQRIEIAIRDSVYVRTKSTPIVAGVPTTLIIRNEDLVRHGFVSPMFAALSVRVEAEGIEVFGKGIEGMHLDSGKTLVMRVTPERQGKMTFHCDLHPDVQGEIYLLDVPVG
ncbi:MAG: cupredoxin domain-containing protein [Nitrospira sp.]|nr:cupredoxin domain-containing protein [Nitrospira sp.]